MNWFYLGEGERHGPFSEAELERRLATGAITSATLIWCDGRPEWQPYGEVFKGERTISFPPGSGRRCVECGGVFPQEAQVEGSPSPVCRTCQSRFREQSSEVAAHPDVGADGVWRDGRILVVRRGATLPHRCVRCGTPASAAPEVRFSWTPPWTYLAMLLCGIGGFVSVRSLFLSIPALLLFMLLFNRRATLEIPLCQAHRQRRRIRGWVGSGLVLAGIVVLGHQLSTFGWFGILALLVLSLEPVVGVLLLLTGLVVQTQASWVLLPQRIDQKLIRLKRCSPEFLAPLPPFKGLD